MPSIEGVQDEVLKVVERGFRAVRQFNFLNHWQLKYPWSLWNFDTADVKLNDAQY